MNPQIYHDEWEEKIVARAMQELNEEERTLLDQHLESCASCSQELQEYNFLVRRLHATEKDIIVPEPSPELMALQQEVARSSIQQEAQRVVEQAFTQNREEEPEDLLSSRSVMVPGSSMRGMLHAQVSRLNERAVIADLQENRNSEYWQVCRLYIEHIVKSDHHSGLLEYLKEDVVQETLISVFTHLRTFSYKGQFTTWLMIIARIRLNDAIRRQQRIKRHETDLEFLLKEEEEAKDSRVLSNPPEEAALINEQLQASLEAMQAFLWKQKGRDRMILQQVFFDGHGYRQTARLIGIPVSTIGHTIHAAREYVKNALEET